MSLTPKPHVGVREIASALGLGKSTVARALKDDPKIAVTTRERVRAEATRRGYAEAPEVRMAMRALRHGRATGHELTGYLHPMTAPVLSVAVRKEIEQVAARLGYRLSWEVAYPVDIPRMCERVLRRGSSGILGCLTDSLTIRDLHNAVRGRVPIVGWMQCPVPEVPVAQVGFRLASGVELALQHARAAGFRKIGLVARSQLVDPLGEFAGCWQAWMNARAWPWVRSLNLNLKLDVAAQLDPWLRDEAPECVVTFHREVIEVARRRSDFDGRGWIYLRKHEVPTSVECAGLDTRVGRQVEQAVGMLASACERAVDMSGDIHLVEPRWSPGATLREASSWAGFQVSPFARRETRVWRTLSLGGVANQPFGGVGGGLSEPLVNFAPEARIELDGVPFEVRADARDGRRSFLLLGATGHTRGAHGVLPWRTRIEACGERADEIYLLHGCAWVKGDGVFAAYTVRYADGTEERREVRAPGRPITVESRARANVNDWWRTADDFENADTRPVWLTQHGAGAASGMFYLHRWTLARSGQRIAAIEVETVGESGTQLGVIAVTLGRK